MMGSLLLSIYETTKGGAGRWPQPIFKTSLGISFYSSPYVVRDFMNITDKLLNQGASFEDIGSLYKYPSRLARFCHTFPSRKVWFMKPNDYLKVGYRLANILSTLYIKNLFNYKGASIIYKNEELLKKFPQLIKLKVFQKTSYSEIKKLSSSLWLLAESFFPRFPNTFFEFSGPYKFGDKFLVIKEFHDLKPDYLKINFHYNFQCLSIVEIYNKRPKINFDIMSRSISNTDNYPENSLVFIDNKYFKGNLSGKISEIQKTLTESVNNLNKLSSSKGKMILFNAQAEYYSLIKPIVSTSLKLPSEFIKSLNINSRQKETSRNIRLLDSIPKDHAGWRRIFSLSKQM